jgi:hypothetical protein
MMNLFIQLQNPNGSLGPAGREVYGSATTRCLESLVDNFAEALRGFDPLQW